MNLEQLNVKELSSEELVETTGGKVKPWYFVDIEVRYMYPSLLDAMFI